MDNFYNYASSNASTVLKIISSKRGELKLPLLTLCLRAFINRERGTMPQDLIIFVLVIVKLSTYLHILYTAQCQSHYSIPLLSVVFYIIMLIRTVVTILATTGRGNSPVGMVVSSVFDEVLVSVDGVVVISEKIEEIREREGEIEREKAMHAIIYTVSVTIQCIA